MAVDELGWVPSLTSGRASTSKLPRPRSARVRTSPAARKPNRKFSPTTIRRGSQRTQHRVDELCGTPARHLGGELDDHDLVHAGLPQQLARGGPGRSAAGAPGRDGRPSSGAARRSQPPARASGSLSRAARIRATCPRCTPSKLPITTTLIRSSGPVIAGPVNQIQLEAQQSGSLSAYLYTGKLSLYSSSGDRRLPPRRPAPGGPGPSRAGHRQRGRRRPEPAGPRRRPRGQPYRAAAPLRQPAGSADRGRDRGVRGAAGALGAGPGPRRLVPGHRGGLRRSSPSTGPRTSRSCSPRPSSTRPTRSSRPPWRPTFALLRQGVEGLPSASARQDAAAAVIASWSLVHGLATLALTGNLDKARIRELAGGDLLDLARRSAAMLHQPTDPA